MAFDIILIVVTFHEGKLVFPPTFGMDFTTKNLVNSFLQNEFIIQ